ncbi:MAG: AmmeMemoRadiSam system protein B [Candidatus Aminicenantes bacterium RBG_19FT_COMBO_58_17]|nr:MAG: AmmeMemoRadiSam system protein B [Candidatus Aminicenantes bacterium RBG_19FT_COMBO_58_17]
MVRRPAVAGSFYPRKAEELRSMVKGMVNPQAKKEKARAVVSPHAGLVYSGPVAGAVYSSVVLPECFVILGPSHRGQRSMFGIMKRGYWQTPLGEVPLDSELAESLLRHSSLVRVEESAHESEHSLEVQLPFIQFLSQKFSIVPVCVSPAADYAALEQLGKGLAAAIRESGRDVLVVASTDMSHYVSQETAREKDFLAIERILALDALGLYEVVQEKGISMCGFQPTTAAILAAKELGAGRADLIRYMTSGETSGDFDRVVGYAGVRIV